MILLLPEERNTSGSESGAVQGPVMERPRLRVIRVLRLAQAGGSALGLRVAKCP